MLTRFLSQVRPPGIVSFALALLLALVASSAYPLPLTASPQANNTEAQPAIGTNTGVLVTQSIVTEDGGQALNNQLQAQDRLQPANKALNNFNLASNDDAINNGSSWRDFAQHGVVLHQPWLGNNNKNWRDFGQGNNGYRTSTTPDANTTQNMRQQQESAFQTLATTGHHLLE